MMDYPVITHGSKIGIHAIRPGSVIQLVRLAAEAGTPFPVVKSVDNGGVMIDVRRISPSTLTIFRRVYHPSAHGVETWDAARMNREADALLEFGTGNLNVEERAAIDWYELLNEDDPPGVAGYAALGRYMKVLSEKATARGVKIALPAHNFGTPEWDEMVAMVATGAFAAMKAGGHILVTHEAVDPFSDTPLAFGSIPGAPTVAGAGPHAWRYRFLYHQLALRDEIVSLVVSEFYAGLGYDLINLSRVMDRFKQYDDEVRKDRYVLAFLPFTIDPDDTWLGQNYTPLFDSASMRDYRLARVGLSNATRPTPPEPFPLPTVPSCLVGLHGRADGPMEGPDFEVVRVANIEAVKLLTTARPEDVDLLRFIRSDMFVLVRLFADFNNGRVVSASDFASWLTEDVRSFYNRGVRYFEIHNEPNLIPEGLGANWTNGAEFSAWWIDVRDRLSAIYPSILWGFPGLSPGGTIAGIRSAALPFLTQCAPAIALADWVGVHCYWQDEAGMETEIGGRGYREYQRRFPGKSLYITEFSNNTTLRKGDQYVRYYRSLQNAANVKAAFSYVVSASRGFESEVWRGEDGVLNEIPTLVGDRAVIAPLERTPIMIRTLVVSNLSPEDADDYTKHVEAMTYHVNQGNKPYPYGKGGPWWFDWPDGSIPLRRLRNPNLVVPGSKLMVYRRGGYWWKDVLVDWEMEVREKDGNWLKVHDPEGEASDWWINACAKNVQPVILP